MTEKNLAMLGYHVLLTLESRPRHGLKISDIIKTFPGTVYNAMNNFESRGLIKFVGIEDSPKGQKCKMYDLTKKGRDFIKSEEKLIKMIKNYKN